MKILLTTLIALVAALGGRWIGASTAGTPARAASTEEPELATLGTQIEELRRENEALARALDEHSGLLVPAALPVAEVGEAQIAAAYERWRAAHPEQELEATSQRGVIAWRANDEIDLAEVPILDLVQALSGSSLGDEERQELFQRLRDAGRMDEYVAAIEKMVAEDPENAELQVALGNAYLQKLFGLGATPEGGQYAFKSDAAFDRALEIDEYNWEARFVKAVSLSNWPAFLGRGPDAIENFEILIQQQEGLAPQPEFAMTYLFLGNVYLSGGHGDDALETWRDGLALFPQDADLLRAVGDAAR